MKIRDVTCTVLTGGPFGERGIPVVRVHSEDGLWGRGAPRPMHPIVTREFVHRQIEPLLVGMDALDTEACWEKMYVTTNTTTVGIGLAAHLHFWASTPACRYAQEYNVDSGQRRRASSPPNSSRPTAISPFTTVPVWASS